MPTHIETLRQQLARQLAQRGADDPQVAHLRWQIVSLERQARCGPGSAAAPTGGDAPDARRESTDERGEPADPNDSEVATAAVRRRRRAD